MKSMFIGKKMALTTVAVVALIGLLARNTSADILAQYHLGDNSLELGSYVGGLVQDFSGNGYNFANTFGGIPAGFGGGAPTGGSISSTRFNGGEGNYGTTGYPSLTSHFTIDIWAYLASGTGDSTSQTSFLFSTDSANPGSIQIGLDGSGNWNSWLLTSVGNGSSGSLVT